MTASHKWRHQHARSQSVRSYLVFDGINTQLGPSFQSQLPSCQALIRFILEYILGTAVVLEGILNILRALSSCLQSAVRIADPPEGGRKVSTCKRLRSIRSDLLRRYRAAKVTVRVCKHSQMAQVVPSLHSHHHVCTPNATASKIRMRQQMMLQHERTGIWRNALDGWFER